MYLDFGKYSNEVNGCTFDKEEFRSKLLCALHSRFEQCYLSHIGDMVLKFRIGYIGKHVFTFNLYYKDLRVSVSEVSDPTLFFEDNNWDKLSVKCDKYVESICNSLFDMYDVSLITK